MDQPPARLASSGPAFLTGTHVSSAILGPAPRRPPAEKPTRGFLLAGWGTVMIISGAWAAALAGLVRWLL